MCITDIKEEIEKNTSNAHKIYKLTVLLNDWNYFANKFLEDPDNKLELINWASNNLSTVIFEEITDQGLNRFVELYKDSVKRLSYEIVELIEELEHE